MASKSSSSSSKLNVYQGEEGMNGMANLSHKLNLLKQKIQSGRVVSVGEKLKKNNKKIQAYASELETLAASRTDSTVLRSNEAVTLLSSRIANPLGKLKGIIDRDDINIEESVFSSTAKLHKLIEKMPPYTTWIFLHRNQRMTDDQSVVGRRRIYYAQHGGEALVCSDSEEDLLQPKGQKLEFSEGEDCMLRTAFKECEISDEVLVILAQFVGGTSSEIKERCHMLMEKEQMTEKQKWKTSAEEGSEDNAFMDKSLGAAIDSFDNLFCRRCLVFDCHLHGCSQNIIYSRENQSCPTYPEDRKPCGTQCYLQLNNPEDLLQTPAVDLLDGSQSKASKLDEPNKFEVQMSTKDVLACPLDVTGIKVDIPIKDKEKENVEPSLKGTCNDFVECTHGWSEWKPFEKDLYMKGLEIFGRNSCFIARNLLCGLKTCKEVSNYMYGRGVMLPRGSSAILSSLCEDGRNAEMENMGPEIKSRICRKRGRTRKLKSSWKSAGHPSLWRRIAHGKDKPYKHYVPCGCQSLCGKECPCQQIGTCCEKYCGCSKACKNRFRGCHCAKSQCRSRQCPCFAAGRECDPDVCRNCRVGCGDGSLGEPPKRGEGQCGNMKLFLRQQQRILLARSDVAGWGAFIKNTVYKNDYLGEYTGELISHEEADRRGKIYDLSNSSFLFDLNDQYVLDAYRKGNKLKFANHSSTPNCYARVMLVSGDHRVGIFANECIEAGEELFYDYRYGPDEAPAWARKRDGSPLSHGRRAKKHQSS